MAQIKIPGLGHSLDEDGLWIVTDSTAKPDYEPPTPRTKTEIRKAEEDALKAERLRAIWKAMAYR